MKSRLAELHMGEARGRALRLICTSSTIIPFEFSTTIKEQSLLDISEFAMHARKINEICSVSLTEDPVLGADQFRYNVSDRGMIVESDYHKALNKIIHAREFVFGYSVWNGEKIFVASEKNLIAAYVVCINRHLEKSCVSIFGMAFCFLTQIVARMKEKHSDITF